MRLEAVVCSKAYIKDIAKTETMCFSEPWSEKAVKEFLDCDYNYAIVVLADGEFAGYVTYSVVFDEMQIANVATLPAFRRCGVASFAVDELKNKGLQSGVAVITLEVRSQNEPAIALYEKKGFVAVGKRKGFYKNPTDDAVLMNFDF